MIAEPLLPLAVDIDSITPYPGNPRRGDISAIANSLQAFGQFKPILVQKSTGHILAGNHTWHAAKQLAWVQVAATVIDVDDNTARRVVIADNRTSELGSGYDNQALSELLKSIADAGELDGTGYDDSDLSSLLDSIANDLLEANQDEGPDAGPSSMEPAVKGSYADVFPPPFPWFGGKGPVASMIWEAIGDVGHFIEPFAGSAAVTINRPADHTRRVHTLNDMNGFLANFWRATHTDPALVAAWCDWPVIEADLTARHMWLVRRSEQLSKSVQADPEFFDPQAAGWWCWGLCSWIGTGWCDGNGCWTVDESGELTKLDRNRKLPHLGDDGMGVNRQLPHLGDDGKGVNRQLPHLGDDGKGVNRQLPHLGNDGKGDVPADRLEALTAYFTHLKNRLGQLRVTCGDFQRVLTNSVIGHHKTIGVFLDPPYAAEDRATTYTHDDNTVAHAAREWAIKNGDDPRMRIVLAGYLEDHDGKMGEGWTAVRWKSRGGYTGTTSKETQGKENISRECLWISPHCNQIKGES